MPIAELIEDVDFLKRSFKSLNSGGPVSSARLRTDYEKLKDVKLPHSSTLKNLIGLLRKEEQLVKNRIRTILPNTDTSKISIVCEHDMIGVGYDNRIYLDLKTSTSFSDEALKYVMLHELGHLKSSRSMRALSALSCAIAALALIATLMTETFWGIYQAQGLLAGLLVITMVVILLQLPVRIEEFMADAFAIKNGATHDAAKEAFRVMGATGLVFNWWLELRDLCFSTHPSDIRRLKYMRHLESVYG